MECPAWRSGSNGQDSTPIIACNAPKSNSGRFRGKALEGSRAGIKPRFPAIVIHLKRHPSYREATNLASGWSRTSLWRPRPGGRGIQLSKFLAGFLAIYLVATALYFLGAWDQASHFNLEPPLVADSLQRCDFNQTVVENRCSAQIGKRVAAGQLIGILVIPREFLPPNGQRHDDARSRPIRNAGPQLQTAAIIEYSDVLPIGDTAGSRVVGMQIKPGLSFRSPQACDVHKAAVEKVARGRRYHRQRKPACEVAAGVLVGCDVIGQRVQTQGARRCRKEFH